MSERDIFTEARGITDPAARSAYLDEACGGDDALRGRLEALLRAHDRPDSLLDAAAGPVAPGRGSTRSFQRPGAVGDGPTRTHGEDTEEDTRDALAFLEPARRPDSVGRLGHYEVLEVLGRGAFGIVYRAFDDVLHRIVAVKVLSPSMAATSPARKRFLREAQSSAKVRHQNVVFIHETGEEPLPYLVMEFVPGETLQQRLDRKGPLDVAEVVRIGRQIAEGLAAAHEQGLIHRDIKPSNILIDSGPHQVKITDFGLARAADDASLTRSGVVAGTPMYMAPEQARGETLDHRADLFSLGSVLYALLTGHPPFRAESTPAVLKRVADEEPRSMREVIPEIPEWLCRIVEKLHAKDPAERYQSAKEVAEVLADCERQLQTHRELKDFARIPEAKPALPHAQSPPHWYSGPGVFVLFCALIGAGFIATAIARSAAPKDLDFDEWNHGWRGTLAYLAVAPVLIALAVRRLRLQTAKGGDAKLARRITRWEWALYSLAFVLLLGNLWFGRPAALYLGGVGELEIVAQEGFNSVIVLRNDRGVYDPNVVDPMVTDWMGMQADRKLKLPPGTYQLNAGIGPHADRRVHHWKVTTSGASGSQTLMVPGGGHMGWSVIVTVERGQRLSVRPVLEDMAIVKERNRDATDPGKLDAVGKAANEFGPDAFVPLFNGRDLTGWTVGGKAGKWRVVDNVLIGSDGPGFLISKGHYRDFHLRVEAKLAAPGNGGINFRNNMQVEINDNPKVPTGSLAVLDLQEARPKVPTGSPEVPDFREARATTPYPHSVVPAEAWFSLEVRAVGADVWVRVNKDPWFKKTGEPPAPAGAPFGLEVLPGAEIHFRKIELKDLSPAAATPLDREDLAKLKGEWLIRLEGRPAPAKEDETLAIRFGDGDFEFRFPGVARQQVGTFQLDAVGKQLTLKFTGQPAAVRCLYRVEGNSLHLTLAGPPGSEAAKPLTADEFLHTRNLMESLNNLRQQGIALHNYHQVHGALPPGARTDKDGKPLLSWRVAILPYIEQDRLYKEFRLDEPWDSEHNKKLIDRMPPQFASPHRKPVGPGLTHFRVFVGHDTAFDPRRQGNSGIRLEQITDGAANTLLVAEAADPVVWTKPDELPFDPKGKLPKLGTPEDGIPVVRCDGLVMMLAPNPTDEALRAFITRSGGEPVPDLPHKTFPLQSRPAYLECRRPAH